MPQAHEFRHGDHASPNDVERRAGHPAGRAKNVRGDIRELRHHAPPYREGFSLHVIYIYMKREYINTPDDTC